ncbi:glycogen synthase GlgA [soil metagenome]
MQTEIDVRRLSLQRPRAVPFQSDHEKRAAPPEQRIPKLLFVTPEISDFVKSGGLGDVSAALPRALRQTHDIRVLIPGYRQVTSGRDIVEIARLPAVAGLPSCGLGRLELPDGLIVYVVLSPELYDRDGSPYGSAAGDWSDNDIRFARLGLAAADMAGGIGGVGWQPDLLHVNDWPTALAPAYLAWRGQAVPTLLTIHNLAYQGLFDSERLPALGIPESAFQMHGVEFYGQLSFLKAGIFYARHATTVSSTYAREITTAEFGCGLEGLLQTRAHQDRLTGILNGIDESWDSRRDPHLAGHFDSRDLQGRQINAAEVRDGFQLGVSRGPLFAIISRLVQQKGIDLAIEAADKLVQQGGQIAVLGQGESQFETALRHLARRNPGRVGVRIGFDEAQARCLYAGSDFLLMPSRFEPCGLSQMYAQRYGSLPVAHKTGGLADTIEDGVTGFLFSDLSLDGFMSSIARAFQSFGSKGRLSAMRRAAMRRTAGWQQSAHRYGQAYDSMLASADLA